MPIKQLTQQDKMGLMDKTRLALEAMIDTGPPLDIVEFAEHPDFLNQPLFPRQKLILRLYYKLPLQQYPCYCLQRTAGGVPRPQCNLCGGSGLYSELKDARKLVAAIDKYARLFIHTVKPSEAYTLSDAELQARLLAHESTLLEIVAGRAGSKTVLGTIILAYESYLLGRDGNLQKTWGQSKVQKFGIANVATNEEQAKILFDALGDYIRTSPWFQKLQPVILDTDFEFKGRPIYGRSYHSNSAGVRGYRFKAWVADEFAFFNRTGGKMSDDAMYNAIEPTTVTFHQYARGVIITSPLNKAGVVWDIFDKAERRVSSKALVFQLATWEMNPQLDRTSKMIADKYNEDSIKAEMEYGAQFADQHGNFMPPEAVKARANNEASIYMTGPAYKCALHVDLAKNHDKAWLVATFYDPDKRRVFTAHCKHFDDPEYRTVAGDINISAVEEYILQMHRDWGFDFGAITFDQYNSLPSVQRLCSENLPASIAHFSEQYNTKIYSTLRQLVTGNGIEWYPEPEIERQLINLTRTFKHNGNWKVEAPLGDYDDLADALAASAYMALMIGTGRAGAIMAATSGGTEAGAPQPLEGDPVDVQHSAGCTDDYCVEGCPVKAAIRKAQREKNRGLQTLGAA